MDVGSWLLFLPLQLIFQCSQARFQCLDPVFGIVGSLLPFPNWEGKVEPNAVVVGASAIIDVAPAIGQAGSDAPLPFEFDTLLSGPADRLGVHHAGMAKEIAEKYETARSVLLPICVDSRAPARSPMTAVMIRVVVSSRAVLGSRSQTMSETRRLPEKLLSVLASPRSRVSTSKTVLGRRRTQLSSRP